MTAGAEVLGLLVILREGHGVGREKFAHREIDVAEQAARIVGATAGALFLRHTVIVHRHQELGIPLQTDDGELAQSNVDPAAFVSAAKLPAEALADGRGHLAQIAVAVPSAAARTIGSTASTTASGRLDRRSMGISGSPERNLEEKILALPSLPNRMARLSKTHRPSTVTGTGQLR